MCSGLVHWDDPEGWYGEGGGRGVQDGEHVYTRGSAFFIVQCSHPYMTNGKTIVLTRQTFVSKVMYLLFNMLSRLVIAFLASKEQGSFNFMAAVTICSDFGAPQNKVCHCFPHLFAMN